MRIALDLDGTIITCENRQSAVLAAILRSKKIEASVRDVWLLKRQGFTTREALIRNGLPEEVASDIDARWKSVIEEPYWLSMDSLPFQTRSTLEDMVDQGNSLYLLTARSRAEHVGNQLVHLGIRSMFKQIFIVSTRNPHIEKSKILLQIMADCFIGDSESDYSAASIAGVNFFGVTSGQRNEVFLKLKGIENLYPSITNVWSSLSNQK